MAAARVLVKYYAELLGIEACVGAVRVSADRARVHDLLAEYGALLDAEQYDDWLALFAAQCCYHVVPRENWQRLGCRPG